jgi:hypothetical protein
MISPTLRTSISQVCHSHKLTPGAEGTKLNMPLTLSPNNIMEFMGEESFYGKFIFQWDSSVDSSEDSRKLVLGSTNMKHKNFAPAGYEDVESIRNIGAYINFEKDGSRLFFILRGESDHFGKPTEQDMKIVASYIKSILEDMGIKSVIRVLEDEGLIVQASLDSAVPIQAEYPPDFMFVAQPECSS